MIAADGGDIIVAAISAFAVVAAAFCTLYGVIFTVRNQRKPQIVEKDESVAAQILAREIERRIQIERERDEWRLRALQATLDLEE